MIKTIRVMLIPNNKQKTKLFQYANIARFAYNWALGREQENYENGGKFISDGDLRKEFTQLKKTDDYAWLNNVSNNVTKQAIKDACEAYRDFFKGYTKFPRFKSKKHSVQKFYQDVEYEDCTEIPSNEGIGIDLGIKDLSICSDGSTYKNINKTQRVKKLEKRKRRLQRSISRKYEKNKKGGSYCKTSNIIKSEKELLKSNHRLTNIRQNYLHQITSEIVKREPSFICIEDLNVKGIMKNRHLSKAIQQQCFGEFRRQIEYKSAWNNIPVIIADKFFPSSKLCSCCGNIKKDLKLSDRIYKCECGNVIDRDYQASLNLKRYGEMVLQSVT